MNWTSDITYIDSLCFVDDKSNCKPLWKYGLSVIWYVTVHWTSDVTYMESLCFIDDKPHCKPLRIIYR